MYVRLGLTLFRKRFFTSLVIILQLFVTILAANILIFIYNENMKDINIMKNFDTDRTYLWMKVAFEEDEDIKREHLSRLEETSSVRGVESILSCGSFYNDVQIDLYGYGENTGNLINMPLESGTWYNKVPKKDGVINCVSISDKAGFEVGEILELEIYFIHNDETITQTFQIVGAMGKRGRVLAFTGSSSDPAYDSLLYNYDSTDGYNETALIFDKNDIAGFDSSQYWYSNRLIFLDSSNDTSFMSLKDELSKYSYVVKLEQAKTNTLQEVRRVMMEFLPIIIPLFLIGFLGVVCISILNTLKYMRNFAIFFICGMRWKDSILICLSYIAYIISGVLILCIPGYVWLKDLLDTGGIMAANNYLFTLGALLAVMLLSLVTPFLLIRKEEPIKVLRKVG